jgi:N6-L-threonylcarbamoyladenine synthase
MKILAIETSCDETAIALVEAKGGLHQLQFRVLKNVVSSQVKIHRPFGGVVPTLAKREHLKNLPLILQKVIKQKLTKQEASHSPTPPKIPISNFPRPWKIGDGEWEEKKKREGEGEGEGEGKGKGKLKDIDLIAVTVGPGLEPALWAGINFAKSLIEADKNQRRSARINPPKAAPLIGVNHLEGHLYSYLLSHRKVKSQIPNSKQIPKLKITKIYPAIVLIVSGGHTILIHQKNLTTWKKIGETRDDAAGEAFDKVARLLGLPYPGGPELEKLALGGNPKAVKFPRPMIHQKNYDFSFSGLKTAVLYFLRESASSRHKSAFRADVAASFQQAIIDVLTQKTIRAANEHKVRSVILSGGVASNQALRKRLRNECRKNKLTFLSAEKKYQTDNAAMIAAAAYLSQQRKTKTRLFAQPNLSL